jgi:multiple sugar transport system substrate-binding protein
MREPKLWRSGGFSSSVSRRSVLKGAGAAGLATLLGERALAGPATLVQSTPTADIKGTSLSLLQWQHFVPSYDTWFEKFLNEWGQANSVTVKLDRINTADVPAALAAEVSAGKGHDLVEHIASLAQYEKSLVDMKDLVDEATKRFGAQLPMTKANSFNPHTGKFYGFCHGYAPDPGDYRKSLWDKAGYPDGPKTYDDLLAGGTKIYQDQGVQCGIGMSQEIDSNMAAQEMMWGFGATMQDKDENVTINSPETIAAVEFMTKLFKACETPEVFGWNAASNNQLLVAGRASYILNSISAYRTAQGSQPDVAKDIFFLKPLQGPGGASMAKAHGHAVFIYMMPTYSKNQDTAREFLLHLVANYDAAATASKLYNFPAYTSTVPKMADYLKTDPDGSEPPDKLEVLADANDWTVNLGWPGPANAMIGESFNTFVLSDMMASAARGSKSAKDAVAEAESKLKASAEKWRKEGLMGGTK